MPVPALSAQIARFEGLRSLAHGSISGSYALVGSLFVNPVRLLKIVNLTDGNLTISYNGVTDHDIIPASSEFLYDISSDKANQAGVLDIPANSGVWVKGSASVNSVYVVVMYASDN